MTALIQAILNSDTPKVRKILYENPDQADKKSDAGDLPIEIARKRGLKKIEVLFVTTLNWEVAYTKSALQNLLVDFIAELSEETYCAGWLLNIELETWKLISGTADASTQNLWKRRGDLDAIEDLRKLKELSGTWAIWDDSVGDAVPISLEEWKEKITSAT